MREWENCRIIATTMTPVQHHNTSNCSPTMWCLIFFFFIFYFESLPESWIVCLDALSVSLKITLNLCSPQWYFCCHSDHLDHPTLFWACPCPIPLTEGPGLNWKAAGKNLSSPSPLAKLRDELSNLLTSRLTWLACIRSFQKQSSRHKIFRKFNNLTKTVVNFVS